MSDLHNVSKEVVLYVCRSVPTGRNRTRYQRANYLCDHYNTYILSRGPVCDEIASRAVGVEVAGEDIFHRFVHPLWLFWKTVWLLRTYDIRYVHTTYSAQTLVAGWLSQRLGLVWIADIFDTPHFGLRMKPRPATVEETVAKHYNRLLLWMVSQTLSDADLIVVSMVPSALEHYGISPEGQNIYPTTNGVDIDLVRARTFDRRSEDLVIEDNPNEITLVYVGPVRAKRGFDPVFDALESLDGSIPHFTLRLVGMVREQDRAWLDLRLPELEYGRIDVLGEVPHEAALAEVAEADICLCPLSPNIDNYDYAYPIKVFEYMAMGKPIIAARLGGTSKILTDGNTGLLVMPMDAEAWSGAIERLVKDAAERNRIGQAAAEAAETYDWNDINDRIWDRIERTVAAPP